MIEKLKSRKLWVAVIGIIIGLATAFGVDSSEYTQIAGVVASVVSGIAYILGETLVDVARAEKIKKETVVTTHEDNRL